MTSYDMKVKVSQAFPQFHEYMVHTSMDQCERLRKEYQEIKKSFQVKQFPSGSKFMIGVREGKDVIQTEMDTYEKRITKYTPWMINHLRDNEDDRYTEWNTDIIRYLIARMVLLEKPIQYSD